MSVNVNTASAGRDQHGNPPPPVQLSAVLNALEVPICVADIDSGALLFTNDLFVARFGAPTGGYITAVERGFAVPPSERFPKSTLLDSRGEPGAVQVGEFVHLTDERSYLVRAVAIRWTPHRLARLHALVDITHRVESERFNRLHQEKLLITSRWMSVGELATTLAHELNQPLGAIGNYIQGAIRRLQSSETPNGDADRFAPIIRALEHARLQADHAARVVSRMREFVRTREPSVAAVDLAQLVQGVVRLIESEAHRHRVSLRLRFPEDLPCALADRVMIEQVVLNLVKNAIEAMGASQTVEREVSVSACVTAEGLIEVSVEDTGPGLSSQTQDQLFSPFFTTKPDGMGIGLSICRSIVEHHNGGLFFSGTPTGGARFWFTLHQPA